MVYKGGGARLALFDTGLEGWQIAVDEVPHRDVGIEMVPIPVGPSHLTVVHRVGHIMLAACRGLQVPRVDRIAF